MKLVRDRIPEFYPENEYRVAKDGTELGHLLRLKLLEEAGEVAVAEDGELLEELADVLEAVYAIGRGAGHTMQDIEIARVMKRRERGGFSLPVVLVRKKRGGSR